MQYQITKIKKQNDEVFKVDFWNIGSYCHYLQNAQGLIKGTQIISDGGTASTHQQVIDELLLLYPGYKEGGIFLSLPDAFFPGDPGADWF